MGPSLLSFARVISDQYYTSVSIPLHRVVDRATHSSQVLPLTAASSSSVMRCPVVKYPLHASQPYHRKIWVRRYGEQSLPAVIFASISTLESSGIQDSGSSTRSRIGMLEGISAASIQLRRVLTLGQRWRRASYYKGYQHRTEISGVKLTCSY
jgi:hypothetical protein